MKIDRGVDMNIFLNSTDNILASFAILILLILYVIQGIILTKLNKLMYGKGTPMAWIPIVNTYLLGKLTIHKIVGWSFIACMILTGTFTVTINNVQKVYTLFPAEIKEIIYIIFDIVTFALFLYAIYKYFKLKKENTIDTNE